MACYTLTTCGGVNPTYTFESTEPLLAAAVGQVVRLSSIVPDSGIGPNLPDGMCWAVEETGGCSTTYSVTIDTTSVDCPSCTPVNWLVLDPCDAALPNIIVGFIGSPIPAVAEIVRVKTFLPGTCTDNTCYEVDSVSAAAPVCWTEDWEIVDSTCVTCEACKDFSITVDHEIREGCKDVYLKINRVGWTAAVTTTAIFLTVDGVKYDISTYIADIFDTGITMTFADAFADGIHCWEIEVVNSGYCDYTVDFCELSLCQACCKLKTLAEKLLKECDPCDDYFKDKFLEAYAIYRALQLAGLCGNESAITKGLKNLDALLIELGCKDCKNC